MPPPPLRQVTPPGMPAVSSKGQRKERLLTALTRMNDRDTQRAAAEELLAIVHVRLGACVRAGVKPDWVSPERGWYDATACRGRNTRYASAPPTHTHAAALPPPGSAANSATLLLPPAAEHGPGGSARHHQLPVQHRHGAKGLCAQGKSPSACRPRPCVGGKKVHGMHTRTTGCPPSPAASPPHAQPSDRLACLQECARAIGLVASATCPLREQALQQPHLGRMLGQLRKSMQVGNVGRRGSSRKRGRVGHARASSIFSRATSSIEAHAGCVWWGGGDGVSCVGVSRT